MRRGRMLLLAALLCLAVLLPVGGSARERAYIGNLDNAGRLNLRAAPNTKAEIRGKYYEGVPVNVLSERNGWAKVDICGRSGYVMSKYLVKSGGAAHGYVSTKYLGFSSAGAQAYQAPVARLRGPWADWYIENEKSCARGAVYDTDILIAGGVFGDFVAVQQWDPFGGEHVYGFVRRDDLIAVPKASPSTQAVLTRDVPVLTGNGNGEPEPWDANGGRPLRRGARVQVLREYGTGNMPYLSEQTRWVFVQAELNDGSAAEVVVPMDAIKVDPLLMLPEEMTRG